MTVNEIPVRFINLVKTYIYIALKHQSSGASAQVEYGARTSSRLSQLMQPFTLAQLLTDIQRFALLCNRLSFYATPLLMRGSRLTAFKVGRVMLRSVRKLFWR